MSEQAAGVAVEPAHPSSLVISAMLAEYHALRQESLNATTNRMTIASFSFGAVAVVLAAITVSAVQGLAVALLVLVAVPQVAKAGLMIWFGEYQRSQRAGEMLGTVEQNINRELGRNRSTGLAMSWEQGVTKTGVRHGYPHLATILLLTGASVVSAIYGFYLLAAWAQAQASALPPPLIVVFTTTVVVVESVFVWLVRQRWCAIKAWYEAGVPPPRDSI